MTTMADLDELALSVPHTTRDVSDDGRPAYLADGKLFCCHRSRRPDAIDPLWPQRFVERPPRPPFHTLNSLFVRERRLDEKRPS